MIDMPSVKQAQNILNLANMIESWRIPSMHFYYCGVGIEIFDHYQYTQMLEKEAEIKTYVHVFLYFCVNWWF